MNVAITHALKFFASACNRLVSVAPKASPEPSSPKSKGFGIKLRDADQAVGTLSEGERQAIAIARAVYFGAKVLILDEPTSALGVKEAAVESGLRTTVDRFDVCLSNL
jgi:ABC-type sugar transport system ATPase subunit